MTNNLKVGYSTGSHAVSALKAALLVLFTGKTDFETVEITLPENKNAELNINFIEKTDNYTKISVIKSDNDDIDVTKGCEIICFAGYDITKIPYLCSKIDHKPYEININKIKMIIHAGKGLGIVTKNGLKPPVGYPAINPVPLEMMKEAFQQVIFENKTDIKLINVIFEVKNGEEIANNTANPKVGIVGGISFLGKKGIVKPISADAYLQALEAEINAASHNPSKIIVFTMGNSSLKFAQKYYKLSEECFVEIGNFVYDSLKIVQRHEFRKIILIANIGKLTKVAQAKKNTNNRYGSIDFSIIKSWLEDESFNTSIITESQNVCTIAALEGHIAENFPQYTEKFYQLIMDKSLNILKSWCAELDIKDISIEIILN